MNDYYCEVLNKSKTNDKIRGIIRKKLISTMQKMTHIIQNVREAKNNTGKK